jgi:hypothetical protein
MSQINAQRTEQEQQDIDFPPLPNRSSRVPRISTVQCERILGESSNSLTSNDSTGTRYQSVSNTRTMIQERQQSFVSESSEQSDHSVSDVSDEEVIQPSQSDLRKQILAIQSSQLSPSEKARKIQVL